MKHLQTTDFYKMKIPTNHPHPYRNGKVGGVHQMKVTKLKCLGNTDLQDRFNIDNHNYSCLAKVSFTKFVNIEFIFYLWNIKT